MKVINYVRDNGSVFRQCKGDGVKKKWEVWTFGKFDSNSGYMLIGQEIYEFIYTHYRSVA